MGCITNAFDVYGKLIELSGCSHLVILPTFCVRTVVCIDKVPSKDMDHSKGI